MRSDQTPGGNVQTLASGEFNGFHPYSLPTAYCELSASALGTCKQQPFSWKFGSAVAATSSQLLAYKLQGRSFGGSTAAGLIEVCPKVLLIMARSFSDHDCQPSNSLSRRQMCARVVD